MYVYMETGEALGTRVREQNLRRYQTEWRDGFRKSFVSF